MAVTLSPLRAVVAALLSLPCSTAAASPSASPPEEEAPMVEGDDPWREVRLALRSPEQIAAEAEAARGPFDRAFGLATYYARWAGSYDAGGVGFRIRWEPDFPIGIDLYAELLDVDVPTGTRVNVPVGFNLYVPVALTEGFRVRGLAGLCASGSFTTGGGDDAPDAQDIQFGVHVGAGAELALGRRVTLFFDATYQGYWGHDQQVGTWSAAIGDELARRDNVELGLGLQVHL